jgi:hypothetical protein
MQNGERCVALNNKSGARRMKSILPQQADTVHDITEVFSIT